MEIMMTLRSISVFGCGAREARIHLQPTEQKDARQSNLLGSRPMESPNVRQRQRHERYIR